MKEFEPLRGRDNRVEIQQEINQQKEYKQVASVRLIPGLKMWSFNNTTGELLEVKIDRSKSAITIFGDIINNAKTQFNPNCIYFQALNRTTAVNKIKKESAIEDYETVKSYVIKKGYGDLIHEKHKKKYYYQYEYSTALLLRNFRMLFPDDISNADLDLSGLKLNNDLDYYMSITDAT